MDADAHGFFEVKNPCLSAMQLWLDKVSGQAQIQSHEAARCPPEDRRADARRGGGGYGCLCYSGGNSSHKSFKGIQKSSANRLRLQSQTNQFGLSNMGARQQRKVSNGSSNSEWRCNGTRDHRKRCCDFSNLVQPIIHTQDFVLSLER